MFVEAQKCALLCFGEVHVRVEQERGEVVLRETEAHALEIDEAGRVVEQQDVLGLEIAMHEGAREVCQMSGHRSESVARWEEAGFSETEMAAQAVLEEVVLFPEVEGFVEGRLESEGFEFGRIDAVGEAMEFEGLLQDLFIERASDGPWFVAEVPEIPVAEVFHPDPSGLRFMPEHFWDAESVAFEEVCDFDVVRVFEALAAVLDEDEAWLAFGLEAEEAAIGAAFFQGLDLDFDGGELWKMGPAEPEDFIEVLGHAKSMSEWEPEMRCPEVTMQRRRWVPGSTIASGQTMESSR